MSKTIAVIGLGLIGGAPEPLLRGTPFPFICSGRVNRPGIRILPEAKCLDAPAARGALRLSRPGSTLFQEVFPCRKPLPSSALD